MTTLNWIDFTKHNLKNNENVRAFSVRHPEAGNLVVLRGVVPEYHQRLVALGYTKTQDGAWVIRARQLNARELQSDVYPLMGMKAVQLEDIDLTSQFLQRQKPVSQTSHPGLSWLEQNLIPLDDGESVSQYMGALPSAVSTSLFLFLEETCETSKEQNGQVHYRGTHNGQYFLLQRRQKLLGGTERVVYTLAPSLDKLPAPRVNTPVPALFTLSKDIAGEVLSNAYYSAYSDNFEVAEYTPSKEIATARAKNALYEDTQLFTVSIPIIKPIVVAEEAFSQVVSLDKVIAVMDREQAQRFIDTMPLESFVTPPGKPVSIEETHGAVVNSRQLAANKTFQEIISARGFDAIVFYRQEHVVTGMQGDPHIDDRGVSTNIIPLRPETIQIISATNFPVHHNLSESFNIVYGRDAYEGFVSLEHKETGRTIVANGNPWFPSLNAAADAIELKENLAVVQASLASEAAHDQVVLNGFQEEIAPDTISLDLTTNDNAVDSRHTLALQEMATNLRSWIDSTNVPTEFKENVDELFQATLGALNDPLSARDMIEAIDDAIPRVAAPSNPVLMQPALRLNGFAGTLFRTVPREHSSDASGAKYTAYLPALLDAANSATPLLIMESEVEIHNPAINDPEVATIGFARTEQCLGFDKAIQIFAAEESMPAATVFDNLEYRSWFKNAGFDGAVFKGSVSQNETNVYQIFDGVQQQVKSVFPHTRAADNVSPFSGNLFALTTDSVQVDNSGRFTTNASLMNAYVPREELDVLRPLRLETHTAKIKSVFPGEQPDWLAHELEAAKLEGFDAVSISDARLLTHLSKAELYGLIQEEGIPETFIVLDPTPFAKHWLDVAESAEVVVESDEHLNDGVASDVNTAGELQETDTANDALQSPAQHVFRLLPGKTNKQIIVAGDSIQAVYGSSLVSEGGKFVKADKGFRFKKSQERALRRYLDRLQSEFDYVTVIDNIRRPFECAIGKEFSHEGVQKVIVSLYRSSNSDRIYVKVGEKGQTDSAVQTFTTTSLQGLQEEFDLLITNLEEINEIVKAPAVVSLTDLQTRAEVAALLARGETLLHQDVRYRVVETERFGWKVEVVESGYKTEKGGDIRGGGFSQSEAIDAVMKEWPIARYFDEQLQIQSEESDGAEPQEATFLGLEVGEAIDLSHLVDGGPDTTRQSEDTEAKSRSFLTVAHVGDKPLSRGESKSLEDAIIKRVAPAADNEKPVSLVESDPIASNSVAADEFLLIHGGIARLLGRNRQHELLYSSVSGQRFCITDDGQIFAELLEEDFNLLIVPPAIRNERFMLLAEHRLNSTASNIVSLADRAAASGKAMSEDDVRGLLESTDPNGLLTAYVMAYGSYKSDLDENPNLDPFSRKKLEASCDAAFEMLRVDLRSRGFEINKAIAIEIAEASANKAIASRNACIQTFKEYVTASQMYSGQMTLEKAIAIPVDLLTSLNPSELHDMLELRIRRSEFSTALVLLAKYYLPKSEISEIIAGLESAGRDEVQQQWEQLNDRLTPIRLRTETPARIAILEQAIEQETSSSPIPNENRRNKIRELRETLALASVKIDEIPLAEDDILEFRNNYSQFEWLLDRFKLSYTATRLLSDRIENIIAERNHQAFLESDEYKCIVNVHALLLKQLPEGVNPRHAVNARDIGVCFGWGSSEIRVSLIETNHEDGKYRYHINHNDSHVSVSTDALPSPEQVAADVLSFAERFKTPGVKIYNTPGYGEYLDKEDEDRYNTTAIAKKIREAIKEAVRNGTLPAGTKVSVRKDSSSAIYCELVAVPDTVCIHSLDFIAYRNDRAADNAWHTIDFRGERYSLIGEAIAKTIDRIANAWNFDNSDVYSDYHHVNYYFRYSLGEKIGEEFERFRDSAYACREAEKTIHQRVFGDAAKELFYPALDLAEHGFFRAPNGQRIGLTFAPDDAGWTLEYNDGNFIPVGDLADSNGMRIVVDSLTKQTTMGLTGISTLLSIGAFDKSEQTSISDDLSSEPTIPETSLFGVEQNEADAALEGAIDASTIEGFDADLLDERIRFIDSHFGSFQRSVISIFPSKGLHLVREWKEDQNYCVEIGSTLQSRKGSAPILIAAKGHATREQAYAAAMPEIEQLVNDAFAADLAMPYIEASCILRHCERIVGDKAWSITDEMREAIDGDNAELLGLYNRLVASGMLPDDHRALFVNELAIIVSESHAALLRIAQMPNGRFVAGGHFTHSKSQQRIEIPYSEHSNQYAHKDDAVVNFISSAARIDPVVAEEIFSVYSSDFAERDSGFSNIEFSSLAPVIRRERDEGSADLLVKLPSAPQTVDVDVHSVNDSEIHAVTLSPQLPTNLYNDVDFELESAGGIRHGDSILFGSDNDYESVLRAFGLMANYFDRESTPASSTPVDKRLAIISSPFAVRLAKLGFIPGEHANTWIINNPDKVSFTLNFFSGLDRVSWDVEIKLRAGERQLREYFEGLSPDADDTVLTDMINGFALKSDVAPVNVLGSDSEYSMPTLDPEEVCQILLAAEISPEYIPDAGVWRISGRTFQLRNVLTGMGGSFSHAHSKPAYEFHINPIHRLAIALKPYIEKLAETHHTHQDFDCFLEAEKEGREFLVKARKTGDTRLPVTVSRHTTLLGARLALAVTSNPDLKPIWEAQYPSPTTEAASEVIPNAQPIRPPVPRPASNEDTPGRRILESLLDSKPEQGSVDRVVTERGRSDQRSSGDSNKPTPADARDDGPDVRVPGRPGGEGLHEPDAFGAIGKPDDRELFDLRLALQNRDLSPKGKRTHATQAIETLLTLRREKRNPSAEEKTILARMIGMGAGIFNNSSDAVFGGYNIPGSQNASLRTAIKKLSSEEYTSLSQTILTAFYTPAEISDFMWSALDRMGLSDISRAMDIVEPAVGVGNFIGTAPDHIRLRNNIIAIECDAVSADIAQLLYPEIRVLKNEFQNVLFPKNSKDLIIGNPPYSDVMTYNPNTKKREVLHDLFLRESVKALRPGGIISFVTSSGTLDKRSDELRREIFSSSDLVYAVRLPNNAFSTEADTSVVTDILFIRKRFIGEAPLSDVWVTSSEAEFEHNGEVHLLCLNDYYKENPARVLGSLKATTSQYGIKLTCTGDGPLSLELDEKLREIPTGAFNPAQDNNSAASITVRAKLADSSIAQSHKVGSYFVQNDAIHVLQYDTANQEYYSVAANLNAKNAAIVKDYLRLKDAVIELLDAEGSPVSDETEIFINSQRKAANEFYERFVSAHGPLNNRDNQRAIQHDPDRFLVAQLERFDKESGIATKADILSRRVTQATPTLGVLSTPTDAAYASMNQFGYVDPDFVSSHLGRPWEEILGDLGDAVFLDPATSRFTLASLYLSGDVLTKKEIAQRAAVLDHSLQRNIEALDTAAPKRISLDQVRIKLGAPWIPVPIVSAFVRTILKATGHRSEDRCYVTYDEKFDAWQIKATKSILDSAHKQNTIEFGTTVYPFIKLMRHCLEQTLAKVTYADQNGNTHIDHDQTQAAQDKQAYIEESFNDFVIQNATYASMMEDAYNLKMNRVVMPKPDGRYLTFPNIATTLKGKPFSLGRHQAGAVERAITSEFGLLIGHEAGGGKTITKVCCAIKSKQLGIASKPMIAVPNHMLVQYTLEALEVFPSARILTVSNEELNSEGRLAFAHKVRLNDWDLVICTHEQFVRMKMPAEYIIRAIENEIGEIEEILAEAYGNDDKLSAKQCERARKKLEERLKSEVAAISEHRDDIDFTQLGVDWVAYDESHYLKNRAFATRNGHLAGVQSITSQRARDAEMKFDWIRQQRGDQRGVVLATGTFICNTIGELMVVLRYLAPQVLIDAGIRSFDHFIATFGEQRVHIEITPDGAGYQMKTRLSRFHNVPELMRMFALVADIKMGDDLEIVRPKENVIKRLSQLTTEQALFMDWLSVRAQRVKARMVKPNEDNLLNIFNDLRTVSVDQRLYHPGLPDFAESKINMEVADIVRAYREGADDNLTQLVFMDQFRHTYSKRDRYDETKGKWIIKKVVDFNLVDDMINKLTAAGIPREAIASIHDCKTPQDKDDLFAKVRAGDVRICFGTTQKMGVGTNAQTRGKDLRHLSYPMRSIDIEQRNKRFVRQGNLNDVVNIHYPTTQGSGDLAMLQMIDRKDKMISQLLSFDFENMDRSLDEEFSPTYEELMAITTNNAVIRDKLECDTKVEALKRKKRNHDSRVFVARREVESLTKIMLRSATQHLERIRNLEGRLGELEGTGFVIGDTPAPTLKAVGVEAHRAANKMGSFVSEVAIGTFREIPLLVTHREPNFYLTLDTEPHRMSVQISKDLSAFPSMLRKMVDSFLEQKSLTESRIVEIEGEIAANRLIADSTFPLEEDYQRLLEKQSALSVEVMKQKALEPDKSVIGGQHKFEALIEQLDEKRYGKDADNSEEAESTDSQLLTDVELDEIIEGEIDRVPEHLSLF